MLVSERNDAIHLLDDYATLEYILVGDLRDILEGPLDAQARRWLLAVVDSLLDTLPREFELQDRGGYMSEVLERHPNWDGQIDELRGERQAVYAKLRVMRTRLARHSAIDDLAAEVRGELRDWMHRLVAHHRHERRMLQTAFNLEVGVGD